MHSIFQGGPHSGQVLELPDQPITHCFPFQSNGKHYFDEYWLADEFVDPVNGHTSIYRYKETQEYTPSVPIDQYGLGLEDWKQTTDDEDGNGASK